jgi:hypothetical protein
LGRFSQLSAFLCRPRLRGTDASFQANYRLTQAFVDAHKAPFLGTNRMWIGNADGLYQAT